jgi:hypothetical protein
MPGKNKTPLLGWHPPAELSAWVRAEAQRRGVSISAVLNEAVGEAKRQTGPGWVCHECGHVADPALSSQ